MNFRQTTVVICYGDFKEVVLMEPILCKTTHTTSIVVNNLTYFILSLSGYIEMCKDTQTVDTADFDGRQRTTRGNEIIPTTS